MKKIMVMAAVAMMSLTAAAQNPAATKQVLASKSYAEAQGLYTSQASSMISEERAKCLNKLVDLAIAEQDAAEKKAVEAQIAKNEQVMASMTAAKCAAAYNALTAAYECDKEDNQPNAKGKVAPKFHQKNQSRLISARNVLVQGGLDAYNTKNYADATKYFGAFVDARHTSLFKGYDFSNEQNYGQICYYAGLAAYFNKEYAKCTKYCDYALATNEKEVIEDVITLKLGTLEEQTKAAEIDTATYISAVKTIYEACPENEMVFGKLVGLYDESGDKANAEKTLNDRLQKNPNDAMALAYVGQTAQAENKFDEAIAAYGKALAVKADFIQVKLNLGVCYLNKAAANIDANTDARGNIKADSKAAIISDLEQAKKIFEELKETDPLQEQVKWKYPLERVVYALDNLN